MLLKEVTAAITYFERGLKALTLVEQAEMVGASHIGLSEAATMSSEYDKALYHYCESIKVYTQTGIVFELLESLRPVARLYSAQGLYERAIELLALVIEHPHHVQRWRIYATAQLEEMRAKLTPDAFDAAYKRGRTLDLDTVVAELLQGP